MTPKSKRKTKIKPLDAAIKNGILAVVSIGASLETAARYFKRDPNEIVKALVDDDEFQRDFKQAREQAEVFFLKQVKTAALDSKNWRAATWSLERLFPDRYGRIKSDAVSVEEIKSLFARLRETIVEEFEESEERDKIETKINSLLSSLS